MKKDFSVKSLRIILRLFMLLFLSQAAIISRAQMKLGDNPTSINSASVLELEATNKGFVLPRLSIGNVSSSSPLPSGLLTGTIVYNTNGSITNGNGVGLYIWNGSQWNPLTPNISGYAWSLTGNAGTNYATNFLGTTDDVSLRFRTNNTERMIIDSLGNIGVGSSAFNSANRERLLVDYGNTNSTTLASLKGSINNYFQVNLQNYNSGSNASTDYIATADDGTDSSYYIDLGINSSTYTRATHNWGGAHDSYLYSNSKNLLIGTATSNDLIFLTGGGVISTNTMMRLKNSTGNIVIGKGDNSANPVGNLVRGPSGNGTNIAGGNLSLSGGIATGNATGGSVNIYGGSTASGSMGVVNINVDSSSNTNINTGASTGNITLGNSSSNINLPKLSASSVVLTNSSKNLTSSTPSNNTYLFYNGSNFTWQAASASAWGLTGNGGTTAGTNFTGTTDAVDFVTKTWGNERMRVTYSGDVGIGTSSPAAKLDVNGGFKLGSSGTALSNIIKTNAGIAAFTITSLGTTIEKTVTVTGAATTNSVMVNPRGGLPGGLAIAYSYVSAANTVSIAFICTLVSINVPATTFDITVIQ